MDKEGLQAVSKTSWHAGVMNQAIKKVGKEKMGGLAKIKKQHKDLLHTHTNTHIFFSLYYLLLAKSKSKIK